MSAVPLPDLVAHRGNALECPENTLESLDSAVALGVRYVEFDVQLTADQVPVLMHDTELRRVAGRRGNVLELPWSSLSEIAVGEVKRLGKRFATVKPPALRQVVAAMGRWRNVTAFVELKRSSIRRFGREIVLNRVLAELEPVIDRCVLISFDLASLKIARAMSRARVGWVLTEYDADALAEARAATPEFLFVNVEKLPADESLLWSGDWQWAIYEIRDLESAKACQRRGARLVETMAVRDMLTAFQESRRS